MKVTEGGREGISATLSRSRYLLDLRDPEAVVATDVTRVRGFKVSDLARYNKAIFAAIITAGVIIRAMQDKSVSQEDVNAVIASVITTVGVFAIANKQESKQ